MSHLNGFYISKGSKHFGEYFAIQSNERLGPKVITQHLMYVGKNKINLEVIRKLNDADSIKSLPLEVLFSDSGRQLIKPEHIQEAYDKKAKGYGILNENHRNLIHRHLDKPENEEITVFDMQQLVKDRINPNDQVSKAIIELTGPEMYEFIDTTKELDKKIEIAKENAKKRTVAKKEDEKGNMSDSIVNEFTIDEEKDKIEELEEVRKIAEQVNQIYENFNEDISKLDTDDQYDFFILQQKLQDPNLPIDHINMYDRELIEKYYQDINKKETRLKFVQDYDVTPKIKKLEAKKQDFLEKHKNNIEILNNIAKNGQLDKIKLDMKYGWQKLQQMEDIQCVVADTLEYRAIQLMKNISNNELQSKDKIKSIFVSDDLRMETFDEIKNVTGAHFSYKLGSAMVETKGAARITLHSYEKGTIRKFLNEQVKSGHMIKQLNEEGNKTTYFTNIFDTINKGKSSLYRKAQIDFKALKLEARKLAKEKLAMEDLTKEERGDKKRAEVQKILDDKNKEVLKEAKKIVKERENAYSKKYPGRKYTDKGREKEIQSTRRRLMRKEERKAIERLIDKSIKRRAKKLNLKKGTEEYDKELKKVKKWHKKYLTLEAKKQEFNLMKKYTLSKKAVQRVMTHENLTYFENLSKDKKWKNIREVFTEEINRSKIDKANSLYSKGIKNFQEFSFMMSMASSNNGELLKNARTVLDLFDLQKMFK